MRTFEDELRDALGPLAGDPVADAANVLERLPATPGPLPPATWWLTGLGIAVGVAVGWLLGTGDDAPEPPPPPAGEATDDDPATDEQDPAEQKHMAGATSEREHPIVGFAVFGPVTVKEPDAEPMEYEGQYYFQMGSSFTTADSQLGLHLYQQDIKLRMNVDTRLTVDSYKEMSFERGDVWVETGGYPGEVVVDTALGEFGVIDGAMIVSAGDGELEVTCLEGSVNVHTGAGENARLLAREQISLAMDTGLSRARELEFLGTVTSWMTYLIAHQMDPTELHERVRSMCAAYEEGTHRDAARREILKLGGRCVPLLADAILRRPQEDEEFRRETAELIANLFDYRTASYVVPLLKDGDPWIRERIFTALSERTGTRVGDRAFWREAPAEERRDAAARWLDELR